MLDFLIAAGYLGVGILSGGLTWSLTTEISDGPRTFFLGIGVFGWPCTLPMNLSILLGERWHRNRQRRLRLEASRETILIEAADEVEQWLPTIE